MKGAKAIVVASVFLMLVSMINSGATAYVEENDYIVRDPIRINGNSDFAAQAADEDWPGDGSEGNPYVIEGYEINGTGYGYGIYIGNTTVHFVVRGCYVHNASIAIGELHSNIYKYYANSGVNLYNVQNGRLENNTIQNNGRTGILLCCSDHNYIANNLIYRITIDKTRIHYGIELDFSSNNIIVNNNISRQGIGIALVDSPDNTVYNNTFTENFWDDYIEVISVNGKPVLPSPIFAFIAVAIFTITITILVIRKKKAKRGK